MSASSGGRAGDREVLISNERLSCDSPVMWPDQNFCNFSNYWQPVI